MSKNALALNNLQWLLCHKTKSRNFSDITIGKNMDSPYLENVLFIIFFLHKKKLSTNLKDSVSSFMEHIMN